MQRKDNALETVHSPLNPSTPRSMHSFCDPVVDKVSDTSTTEVTKDIVSDVVLKCIKPMSW